MANITGRETVIALKKAAAWRTAVAVGAGDGQFILADALTAGHAHEILRDESVPLKFVQDTDTGLETISGDLSGFLRYQGQELPLALAMGDPQTKVGAGPTYTMDVYLETTLRGLFATYVSLLESAVIAEVPSLKIHGFDLSADFGNPVEVAFHCTGNRLLLTGDAGIVNTTTETDAVTVDDEVKQNRVIFDNNSDFWINIEGGAALAVGDRLGIASFGFTFDRPIDAFAVVNASDQGIEEPIGSGFPDPQLTITLPEFDATDSVAYKAAFRVGTTYKAKLLFAKGTDYEFNVWFPRLRVVEDAPAVSGPGRIENSVTFACLMATAAPTGFANELPFYIDTKNKAAADPF